MRRAKILLGLVIVCAACTRAQASIEVKQGDVLQFASNQTTAFKQSPGGEFLFNHSRGGDSLGSFYTFCAQLGEYITQGQSYTVASVQKVNSPFPPPAGAQQGLTALGAWIYESYVTGGTSVFSRENGAPDPGDPDYRMNTNLKAGQVQYALWRELGYNDSLISSYGFSITANHTNQYTAWDNEFKTLDPTPSSSANVWIAWLQSGNGDPAQDTFVYFTQEGSSPIPEPASLAIWSVLAMGAAGLASRRRSSRRRWSESQRQAIREVVTKA